LWLLALLLFLIEQMIEVREVQETGPLVALIELHVDVVSRLLKTEVLYLH